MVKLYLVCSKLTKHYYQFIPISPQIIKELAYSHHSNWPPSSCPQANFQPSSTEICGVCEAWGRGQGPGFIIGAPVWTSRYRSILAVINLRRRTGSSRITGSDIMYGTCIPKRSAYNCPFFPPFFHSSPRLLQRSDCTGVASVECPRLSV